MIAIADYGMGNRRSVEKALAHVGAPSKVTADHDEIRAADAVILPGVGAFPEAMRNLDRTGLGRVLTELTQPLLGICLGMQLLFESSTEHEGARGLGILPGTVTRLRAPRLPHIGWNEVRFDRDSRIAEGLPDAAAFYHVHSFACRPADPADAVGTSEYGERFVSVVERGNVMAVQFHPEKSSRDGLRMLGNFARLAATAEITTHSGGPRPPLSGGGHSTRTTSMRAAAAADSDDRCSRRIMRRTSGRGPLAAVAVA